MDQPNHPFDVDLAIIGGGFWGTACALMAREAGIDAILIDDGAPWSASRNAAGMVHPDWFKGGTIGKLIPASWSGRDIGESLQWLMKYGLQRTSELFRGPAGDRLRNDAFMMLDVPGFLAMGKPRKGNVTHLHRYGSNRPADQKYWRIFGEYGELGFIDARRVIVAAGVHTDTLLDNSSMRKIGVERLRGRGLVIKPKMATASVSTFPFRWQTRPYVSYTLRPWGMDGSEPIMRFGDTTEPQAGKKGALTELRGYLSQIVGSYEELEVHDGQRPVCEQFTVAKVAPALVVATGGHRVGLGIAGTAAKKALEALA
jgi:glycine/D-amino acid oxidase-like deaminating enzyme